MINRLSLLSHPRSSLVSLSLNILTNRITSSFSSMSSINNNYDNNKNNKNNNNNGVCLVFGAGSGIGGHVARRFAKGGYTTAIVRKRDDQKLMDLKKTIESETNSKCHAFLKNATDNESVLGLVNEIENEIGPISVCVYNIGANIGHRTIEKTEQRLFKKALDLGVGGAYIVSKAVTPHMKKRKRGKQRNKIVGVINVGICGCTM